jgi:dissimilatory sulfite reductase (desulfoviridin) alpha/beta subunit
VAVCDSGTLVQGLKGYRVQLGGKLGRHPQLARELPGIYSQEEVLNIIQWCLDFYKHQSRSGERFAEIFTTADFERLTLEVSKKAV